MSNESTIDILSSALNLLGVTSLLGNEVSKNSLKYININSQNGKILRIFTSFLVIPGLYGVSSQILKRNDKKIARILSPGDRENKKTILGLKGTDKYKYIGLNSGTKTNVSNIFFEAWLNKKNKLRNINDNVYNSIIFRNGQRCTIIGIIKCIENKNIENDKIVSNNLFYFWINLFSIIFEIVSILLLILIIKENDIIAILIVILNMLSTFLIVLLLSNEKYSIPNSNAKSYKLGNSLVTNQNGNDIWIVLGEENQIQNLLQLEIESLKQNRVEQYFEIIISTFGCLISICSILFIPLMKNRSKLFYGLELLIGLLSSLLYSSRDGNKILMKITENYYKFDKKEEFIKFSNRASSIAYSLLKTKGNHKETKNLIPDIDEWIYFGKILDKLNKNNEIISLIKNTYNENSNIENSKNILVDNFKEGKKLNKSELGKRLLEDILEGLIECYKENNNNQNINETVIINLEIEK